MFDRNFFGGQAKINPGDCIIIHEGERGLLAYLDVRIEDGYSIPYYKYPPIFPDRAQKEQLHPGHAKITGLKSKNTYGFFTAEMLPPFTAPSDEQIAQYLYDCKLFQVTVQTLAFGDSSAVVLENCWSSCYYHCFDSDMKEVSGIVHDWFEYFGSEIFQSEKRKAIELLCDCGYLDGCYSQPSDDELLQTIPETCFGAETVLRVKLPDERGEAVVLTKDREPIAVLTAESGVDMGLLLEYVKEYPYKTITSIPLVDFCAKHLHGCTAAELFSSLDKFRPVTNYVTETENYENDLMAEAAGCGVVRKYRFLHGDVEYYDTVLAYKDCRPNIQLLTILDFSTEEIQSIILEVNRVNATARKRIATMVKKGKLQLPMENTSWWS